MFRFAWEGGSRGESEIGLRARGSIWRTGVKGEIFLHFFPFRRCI